MIYTIDNPKLVKYHDNFKGLKSFTGVVKDKINTIVYYSNGKRHREDGPAIELHNGNKYWYLYDKLHREDGPAIERTNGSKCWYLNGKSYGWNDDFTNKSWIRFVELQLLK